MNKRVNHFLKNTGIFLVGSFGSKFLSFLLLPLYTSLLSTNQYGQIDLVTTTQSLIFPIVTLGLTEAIFRFIMMKNLNKKSILSDSFFIMTGMYVLVFILSQIINIFIKWKYIYWMLIILACSMFYDILINYLKANQASKKYVAIGLAYTLINLLCNVLFIVVFNFGIEGYLGSLVVAYSTISLVVFFKEKIYKEIKIQYYDKTIANRMLKYSFPLIFSSLSWWIVTSSDKYMIRLFLGDSDVGIYSIASKIPLILQSLITILQTVWQISTNDLHDNESKETLVDNFVLFMKAFRQTGFIAGSILLVLTKPIMSIIAKNDFYLGWRYAPFLILSIVFSFSTGMVSTLYGAYEKNRGVLYSVLLGGLVNILLNWLLIPNLGVMGATISTAISRLIIAIYRLKDTEKLLKFHREYGNIAFNGTLITIQSILLIICDTRLYCLQLICLALITVYNRAIFIKAIRYINAIIKSRRTA